MEAVIQAKREALVDFGLLELPLLHVNHNFDFIDHRDKDRESLSTPS